VLKSVALHKVEVVSGNSKGIVAFLIQYMHILKHF